MQQAKHAILGEIKSKGNNGCAVTFRSGFMGGCLIGPYFFEIDIVQAVAVDGHRYHDMLNIFFIPQVESMDIIDTHFQQDGAT